MIKFNLAMTNLSCQPLSPGQMQKKKKIGQTKKFDTACSFSNEPVTLPCTRSERHLDQNEQAISLQNIVIFPNRHIELFIKIVRLFVSDVFSPR
jgi:hypothetical protein